MVSLSLRPSLTARSLISRTRSLGKSNVVFMEPFCWFPSFLSTRALDDRLETAANNLADVDHAAIELGGFRWGVD